MTLISRRIMPMACGDGCAGSLSSWQVPCRLLRLDGGVAEEPQEGRMPTPLRRAFWVLAHMRLSEGHEGA